EQLGLSEHVQVAVGSAYEQWDGKGWPGSLSGADIPLAARLTSVAEFTEVAHRVGGTDAAVALATKRSGSQFDPSLSTALADNAEAIFSDLEGGGTWEAVIEAEPTLGMYLSPSQFDAALLAIADYVDLKSPYTLGHARAVADLSAAAGTT